MTPGNTTQFEKGKTYKSFVLFVSQKEPRYINVQMKDGACFKVEVSGTPSVSLFSLKDTFVELVCTEVTDKGPEFALAPKYYAPPVPAAQTASSPAPKPTATIRPRPVRGGQTGLKEGPTLELKQSLVFSPTTHQPDSDQPFEIAKEIAAFMNTAGGDLYLGVDDHGFVTGIEGDLPHLGEAPIMMDKVLDDKYNYKSDLDGFTNKLATAVRCYLGTAAAALVGPIDVLDDPGGTGLRYVRIHVKPSPDVVYLGRDESVVCRAQASVLYLKGRQRELYVKNRFYDAAAAGTDAAQIDALLAKIADQAKAIADMQKAFWQAMETGRSVLDENRSSVSIPSNDVVPNDNKPQDDDRSFGVSPEGITHLTSFQPQTEGSFMEESFSRALSSAPTKVAKALEKLRISDWNMARALLQNDDRILSIPGCGVKTLNCFRVWMKQQNLEGAGAPPVSNGQDARSPAPCRKETPASQGRESGPDEEPGAGMADTPRAEAGEAARAPRCRDFASYEDWVGAVFPLVFPRPSNGREDVLKFRLGLLTEAEPLTLQEVADSIGLTRERVRQIEAQAKQRIAKEKRFLHDLENAFEAVTAQAGYVIGREDFLSAFSQQVGWDVSSCIPQLLRLLAIVERKVEGFPNNPLSNAKFIVVDFAFNGKARYDRFLDYLEREVTTARKAVEFKTIRSCLSNSGVPDLSETEYAFFAEKAISEREKGFGVNRLRVALGKASRRLAGRSAILEVLRPAGLPGLTMQEIESRLRERLGDRAPCFRAMVGRALDERGTSVWIVKQGGGQGNETRYALSSFCPEVPEWLVEQLEKEMAEHLRANRCDAALLSRFYDQWKTSGRIPADIPERFLLETLKRKTKGIVIYPDCHGSPAFALPESGLVGRNNTGLLRREARLYFSDRRLVPQNEVLRFATDVFGYHTPIQAGNECDRFFAKEGDSYVVNP